MKQEKDHHLSKAQEDNSHFTPEKNLPYSLRSYLFSKIESELFSQHKIFIRCSNHLNQIKYLTWNEINNQHEFYPHENSFFEKISSLFKRKIRVPNTPEVNNYITSLRKSISEEIDSRIKAELDLKEKLARQRREKTGENQPEDHDDAYYRSHPEYKQYRNHLGETRWMTKGERESQDEFTEEVYSAFRILFQRSKWIVLFILVISALVYLFKPELFNPPERGYLLVFANERRGNLYINEKLRLGTSLNSPIKLLSGNYRITYNKDGFESAPSFIDVDIKDQDTSKVAFILLRVKKDEKALVKINAIHQDAKVFVENSFYGRLKDNKNLYLAPGKHRIALKKDKYVASPPHVDLNLNAGDSVNIRFDFIPRSTARARANEGDNIGLVEVTSNIADAKIMLDGKDSGYRTDYIFYKVPFGEHSVSVQKDGYVVEPSQKHIRLTELNPHHRLHFKLRRADIAVSLKTTPVKGSIYLDGKQIGSGEWKGRLAPGKYQVRFGPIDQFQKPESQSIEVGENLKSDYTFSYVPLFNVSFSPQWIRPRNNSGSIQIGYLDEDRNFISDPSNAPEILMPEGFTELTWILGYAFAYRNPPLNDAIVFTFNIPKSINLKNNMWLKMWGYRTDEKYPLQFTNVSEINISVNNRIIQEDYTPKFSIEEASEKNFERFRINNLLHQGKNRLLISTSSVNTTYFSLWKILIE
jgi:hypothetical protein